MVAGNPYERIDRLLEYAQKKQIAFVVTPEGRIEVNALTERQADFALRSLQNAVHGNKSMALQALKTYPDRLRQRIQDRSRLLSSSGPLARAGNTVAGLLPQTPAGQAAAAGTMGAALLQPEISLPALIVVGALSGLAGEKAAETGEASAGVSNPFSIEREAKAAGVGALTGLVSDIPGAARGVYQAIKRPAVLDRDMTIQTGKYISDVLSRRLPKTAGRIITSLEDLVRPKGKNTVMRVLGSKEANDELTQMWRDAQETVITEIERSAKKAAFDAASDFQQRFGWSVTGQRPAVAAGSKQSPAERAAFRRAVRLIKRAKSIGSEMRDAFEEIGGLRRDALSAEGELRRSYSAWEKAHSIGELSDSIDAEIESADPSGHLSSLLADTRDTYSKFSGFRDLFGMENVMDPTGRWLNSSVAQRALDSQTNSSVRYIEARLKDSFGPLRDVIRRSAPELEKGQPVISDIPMSERFRAPHTGVSVPGGARIYAHFPSSLMRPFTKYIGGPEISPSFVAGRYPALLSTPTADLTEGRQSATQP